MNEDKIMAKTVTLRMDDETYSLIKKAAEGEKRSISNFLEWAAYSYITDEIHIGKAEMDEILKDSADLDKGIEQAKAGKYRIVK